MHYLPKYFTSRKRKYGVSPRSDNTVADNVVINFLVRNAAPWFGELQPGETTAGRGERA